jgi:uncharacterized short protein YbdD (DUF466 family)
MRPVLSCIRIDGDTNRRPRACAMEDIMVDLPSVIQWVARAARVLVGQPDYDSYVAHRRRTRPGEPIMTYEEFFRDRQQARYAFDKGKIRGCG